MSGLLAIRTLDGSTIDRARWRAAVARVEGEGVAVDEKLTESCGVAAWRRATGEFAASGKAHGVESGRKTVAWVGQCVDDSGDTTEAAIQKCASLTLETAKDTAGINGAFSCAVLDEESQAISIVVSRFAHYPVYVHQSRALFVASTDLACLIPWMDAPKFDPAAINLLLRAGELVGRMTPLKDVQMAHGGSFIAADERGVRDTTYWRYRSDRDTALGRRDAVEMLAERFTGAVRRIERASERMVIPLSGGLDSRMILAACERPDAVPSFTFGPASCRDARFAKQIAAKLGSAHSNLDFPVEAYPALWSDAVRKTCGCFGLRDMFILPFTDLLARQGDVALNGLFGGGSLGGEYQQKGWYQAPDLESLANATWSWRSRAGEQDLIDGVLDVPAGEVDAKQVWSSSLLADSEGRPIDRLNDWILVNRNFRYVNGGSALLRLRLESHSPFLDHDFIDALVKTPLEWRYLHRLYVDVLKRVSRKAASVPWDRTCIPPAWGNGAVLASLGVQRCMRIAMSKIGKSAFSGALYADPGEWMRNQWKDPIEDVLLSDEALQAGPFNADGVRSVWRKHQEGSMDCSRLLGIMAALEILRRDVLDASIDSAADQRAATVAAGGHS